MPLDRNMQMGRRGPGQEPPPARSKPGPASPIEPANRTTPAAGIVSRARLLLSALVLASLCSSSLQTPATRHAADSHKNGRPASASHQSRREDKAASPGAHAGHSLGSELPLGGVELGAKADLSTGGVVGAQLNVLTNQKLKNELGQVPDGVKPSVSINAYLKLLRFQGQGGTVWNLFQYRDKRFAVPNNGNAKPSRVVNPDGVIVDILSSSARKYGELRTVWATVTFPRGEYLNIDEDIWQQVSEMKVVDIQSSLAVAYLSGNIISPNQVAFGEAFAHQILEITDKLSFVATFDELEARGSRVEGGLYSSSQGYRELRLASAATKDAFDTYRVCVYCLAHEMTTLQPDQVKSFDDATNLLKNSKELEKAFWSLNHAVPSNVFIEASYASVDSVLVPVEKGTFIRYDAQDLLQLVELHQMHKLKNEWLTKATKENLLETSSQAALIVFNDDYYYLNLQTAREYAKSVAKNFERQRHQALVRRGPAGPRLVHQGAPGHPQADLALRSAD